MPQVQRCPNRGALTEGDGEGLQAAQGEGGAEGGVAGLFDMGEPTEQCVERELGFGAGEGGAETMVDAAAERDVSGAVAGDVEAVGLIENMAGSRLAAPRIRTIWSPSGMV